MATCLSFDEIVALGEPQIARLLEIGNRFEDAYESGACEAFSKQVRNVESFLVQTYVIAISIARRSDLNETLTIWEKMEDFCTSALKVLSDLKNKYSDCGTPELHDLALDYKLACQKRYNNISEEIECQNIKIPEGLFPETK